MEFTLWHREGRQWLIYTGQRYDSMDSAILAVQDAYSAGEECMAVTDGSMPTDADIVSWWDAIDDLESARREHNQSGGYLLCIGDRPAKYVVCDEQEAMECWGRSIEYLQSLAPDFSEA